MVEPSWEYDSDLGLALELADIADAITTEQFGNASEVIRKRDGSPVLAADRIVEERIIECLRDKVPSDSLLCEESGQSGSANSRRRWIIDPIDHTRHFARGNPEFATMIALTIEDEPVVGVISAPCLGKRWWAGQAIGAWSHVGIPLQVSAVERIEDASVGIAGHREWVRDYEWVRLADLLDRVDYVFGNPGGFLPFMLVAEGVLDATLEPWGGFWDHVASRVIVAEAGGTMSRLDGQVATGGSALASNGALHELLLAQVRRLDSRSEKHGWQ